MNRTLCFAVVLTVSTLVVHLLPGQQTAQKSAVDALIPWLLKEGDELRGVPFSEVIFDTTGKRVVPIERANPVDERVIKHVSGVLDEVVKRMNAADNPVQSAERINEVSSHFEDLMRDLLDAPPAFSCDFPRTGDGKIQRSGYPDLRLVDTESKRVFYLDPKLYAAGSRESSFRTFYFEPKVATNKVRDDAVHLIVGFEHQPPASSGSAGQPRASSGSAGEARAAGHWNFTRWDVVDLSHFKVKLKAEFQGSNRDMYRPEAIVASSAK